MGIAHGTTTQYRYGCRCEECKAAQAVYLKKWRQKNAEHKKEYAKKDWQKNKKRYQQQQKLWRMANQDYGQKYYRIRANQYPQFWLAYTRANELRRNAPLDDTAFEWAKIIKQDPCSYCGKRSNSIDHIDPIILGGKSNWDNLTPACRSCNSSKNSKRLFLFLSTKMLNNG